MFTSKPYWFEHKFFNLIKKLECEVVVIPGNHDFYLASKYAAIKRNECSFVPKNFHILIDEGVTIKGIRFYGTPWVPYINGIWCFEEEDADLADRFLQMPAKVDVLITHSPPFMRYREIDVSLDNKPAYRRHFGSESLARVIDARAPRMVLCGHIHSGDHKCAPMHTTLENSTTYVWNVSRVNEAYNIAYKIRLFELNPSCIREMPFNEPYVILKGEA